MNTVAQRLWMLAPAAMLYSVDIGLTLSGQSPEYWGGRYGEVLETNPVAAALLARGPWWFAWAAVAWGLFLIGVIVVWRHPAAGWLAVLLAVGHALGAGTWLVRIPSWGWPVAVAYFVVASQGSRCCWRRAGWLRSAV